MIGVLRIPHPARKFIDMKLGFALMRDRRVPLRSKLSAVLAGLLVTGLVEFLELPVEGVLSLILPIIGLGGDMVIDGAELVAGPLLLAHLLLPWIAPRAIVERIRAERNGEAPKGRVIDI
ncbi:MAG TPA: hypothetical protein VHY22_17145 [Chthoniobacteraceae bacterium]|jgi:hypothetical protein|nr:hypothetical protein [Chthoniobacteraceae bacterium]